MKWFKKKEKQPKIIRQCVEIKSMRINAKSDGWIASYHYAPINQGISSLTKAIEKYNAKLDRPISLEIFEVHSNKSATIFLIGEQDLINAFPQELLSTDFFKYFSYKYVKSPSHYNDWD